MYLSGAKLSHLLYSPVFILRISKNSNRFATNILDCLLREFH